MGKNTPGANQLYAKNSRHFGRIRREHTRKEEYLELRGRRNGFHRRDAWARRRFDFLSRISRQSEYDGVKNAFRRHARGMLASDFFSLSFGTRSEAGFRMSRRRT